MGRAAFLEPDALTSPDKCGDFFTIIFDIFQILVKKTLAPLLILCYYVHIKEFLKINKIINKKCLTFL